MGLCPRGGDLQVLAVTGTNGKTTTARLINHLLAGSGLRTGMTNTDGVYVDGRQTDSGDCSGPKSARNVLLHPDVDAAVFEVARGGVLREGLGFDRCGGDDQRRQRRPPRPQPVRRWKTSPLFSSA